MSKGLWVTVISYSLFIVLPFMYLLTTVQTLLTNGTKATAQVDNHIVQPDTRIYRS